jgi:hypothetical protein
MSTRATPLSPFHVEALNLIDIEFYSKPGRKYRKVIEAWKAYYDHLGNIPENDAAESVKDIWRSRRDDYLVELLYEMGKSLGYEFDKVHIRRAAYFPEGHGQEFDDQYAIRKGLRAFLSGRSPVSMRVVDFPQMDDTEEVKRTRELLTLALEKFNSESGADKQSIATPVDFDSQKDGSKVPVKRQ